MKFLLKWPNHANAVASGLLKLFKENFKTDFELSINGSYIKAHHLILAMFCSRVKSQEKSTLILGEQSSLSEEDVHQLLDFIYSGQIDVDESRLVSLKELSHLIGFQDLFNIITAFLNSRNQAAHLPTRSSKRIRRISSSKNEKEKAQVNNNVENKNIGKESDLIQETQSEESSNDDEEQEPEAQSDSNDDEYEPEMQSDSNDGEQTPEPRSNSESIAESETRKTTEPKYACKFCSYTNNFKNNKYFALHMISKHRVDLEGNPALKNFQCPQCPKAFYAKEFLRKHIYTVHWEKRFVCEQCGVKFRYSNNLKVHVQGKHSKIKPYICEMCGKQFSFANILRAHYETHVPNIVKCEVCGDSVTKGSLKKHMINKHSNGPKTHKCTFCSFGTWNNWNLKTHLKNVHKVTVDAQVNQTFYEN